MEILNDEWQKIINFFKKEFTQGEEPEMDVILFLIGVQELGQVKKSFSKDEKVNLIHIATCKLLEPYGYYKFEKIDDDGWPHYIRTKLVDSEIINNQEKLIKKAIINYFKVNNIIK